MTTRAQIVAEARTWIGTRYQHQGALKGIGCDCIGLVAGAAFAAGLPSAEAFARDTRWRGYGRAPDPIMLLKACAEYFDPIAAPDVGDVLVMSFVGEPQHFALLSGVDYIIHSYAQARRVVEHRLDAVWRARIVRYFRFRGLDG